MSSSFDVRWTLDDVVMEGTVVRPDGDGPFPAVVFVAGSGPTDRDWCSPALPGDNGSARLFAEAFAAAGIASIRYDKRASGPHVMENLPTLSGRMSMRSHLDELTAAIGALADQDFVDAARIVGVGNSEGTLHLLHHVESPQPVPLVGLVLLAPPGRAIQDVLLGQLALQSSQIPGGSELMPLVREAAARFAAGGAMDPDPSLPESVRMVLASFDAPANLPFARELWTESGADALARVPVPTLVLIGERDVQVDARLDGDPLRAAVAGRDDVTFAFPPEANHVFKRDRRTPAEVAASPGNGYNEPGTVLDPESLRIVLDWLAGVLGD